MTVTGAVEGNHWQLLPIPYGVCRMGRFQMFLVAPETSTPSPVGPAQRAKTIFKAHLYIGQTDNSFAIVGQRRYAGP